MTFLYYVKVNNLVALFTYQPFWIAPFLQYGGRVLGLNLPYNMADARQF